MITETRKPTTPIKFPSVFVRFLKLRGSFTLYPRPNWVKPNNFAKTPENLIGVVSLRVSVIPTYTFLKN